MVGIIIINKEVEWTPRSLKMVPSTPKVPKAIKRNHQYSLYWMENNFLMRTHYIRKAILRGKVKRSRKFK